jgi:phosphoglycolate phosphatase-like HAD superfamily hydrolase
MNAEVKMALCDIDGTLMNTEEYIYKAYAFALGRYGFPKPSTKQFKSVMGRPLDYCYERFAPGENFELLRKAHHEYQEKNLHECVPFPGAIETLDSFRDAGIKIGAVTTRYGLLIESLEACGIMDYFDYLIKGMILLNTNQTQKACYMYLIKVVYLPPKL